MLLVRAGLLAVLLAGCPSDPESAPPCDVSATTPIEIVVTDASGDVHALADGGDLYLQVAPQGGFITLIAPRVQVAAADRCQIQISAAVRNPATNLVVGLEQRPIIVERDGTWLQPPSPADLSDLANVALCPVGEAVADQTLRVEVDVLAANGQPITSAARTAVPRCTDGDTYCRDSCAGPI